jgi:hypothetical protein
MKTGTDFHAFLESAVGKSVEMHFVSGQSFTGVVQGVLADAVQITEGATGPANVIAEQHIVRVRMK